MWENFTKFRCFKLSNSSFNNLMVLINDDFSSSMLHPGVRFLNQQGDKYFCAGLINKPKGLKVVKEELRSIGSMVDKLNG